MAITLVFALAVCRPAGRSIAHPTPATSHVPSTAPYASGFGMRAVPSHSAPTPARTAISSDSEATTSDDDDDSSATSSADSDGESGDNVMQMARLQTLIQAAGRGSSSELVQFLMQQRGPPATIMRNFEGLLRRLAGPSATAATATTAAGTLPTRQANTPVPSSRAPAPSAAPLAHSASPSTVSPTTRARTDTQRLLAQQFDALADISALNRDGTAASAPLFPPTADTLSTLMESDMVRAGLGLGMNMARHMNMGSGDGGASQHRTAASAAAHGYHDSDSDDDDNVMFERSVHLAPEYAGVDTRSWFRSMRDEASSRLQSGHAVVSRIGQPHTITQSGSVRPVLQSNASTRTIVLMPMTTHLEDRIQSLAESIAASYAASTLTSQSQQPAQPPPKPKRRVANVPEASNWKCDKCAHANDALTQSCTKCFAPAPHKPDTKALPAGVALVPSKVADECVICFDGPKDTLLAPCGHVCCCIACANKLLECEDKCPVCRGLIENAYKVFAV